MARRNIGVLMRLLVGNGNKPRGCGCGCAGGAAGGLLLVSSSSCCSDYTQIRTLTIPSSRSHPTEDTLFKDFTKIPLVHSEAGRLVSPSNGFIVIGYMQYSEILQKVKDKGHTAIFVYAPAWCSSPFRDDEDPIKPKFYEVCDQFPYLPIFVVYVEPNGGGIKLHNSGVYKRPAFHVYLRGKKEAELACDSVARLNEFFYSRSWVSRTWMDERRAQAKKDKNDGGVDSSQLVEVLPGRFPASSTPKVMAVVESFPGGARNSDMWWFAQGLFSSQEKREDFASLEDPLLQLKWLKREIAEE